MVGAEWSFVLQNEKNFTDETLIHPNLQEAALLLRVVQTCEKKYREGAPPLNEAELKKLLAVSQLSLLKVLDFLTQKGVLIRSGDVYAFAYVPEKIDLINTVKEFLEIDNNDQSFGVASVIALIAEK